MQTPTLSTFRVCLAATDVAGVQRCVDQLSLKDIKIIESQTNATPYSPSDMPSSSPLMSPVGVRHQPLQVKTFRPSACKKHPIMYMLDAMRGADVAKTDKSHAAHASSLPSSYGGQERSLSAVERAHVQWNDSAAAAQIVTILSNIGIPLSLEDTSSSVPSPSSPQRSSPQMVECVDNLSGNSLLHVCVAKGLSELLAWLLNHLSHLNTTLFSEWPLSEGLLLSEASDKALLRYLTLPNAQGLIPLQLAVKSGACRCVEVLVQVMRTIDEKTPLSLINQYHLLHMAAAAGHVSVARYLLSASLANIDLSGINATALIGMRGLLNSDSAEEDAHNAFSLSIEGGGSPFHLACSYARAEVVAFFLAEVDARITGNMNRTASTFLPNKNMDSFNPSMSDSVPAVAEAQKSSPEPSQQLTPLLDICQLVRFTVAEARSAIENIILEKDARGRCSLHCAADGRANDGEAISVMQLLIGALPSCIHALDDGKRNASELAVHKGNSKNALAILSISKSAGSSSASAHVAGADKFHQMSTSHLRQEESYRPSASPMLNTHNTEFSTSVLVNQTINNQYVAKLVAAMAPSTDTLKDLSLDRRAVFQLPKRN